MENKTAEYISDFRLNGRKQQFKIKWKGEKDAEWKSLEEVYIDREMIQSFKDDFLIKFLSFCDNRDYEKAFLIQPALSVTQVFARIGLLGVPVDFEFVSSYELMKNKQREKLAEAAEELNKKLLPKEQIHVENEVDLELLNFEWSNKYETSIDLTKNTLLQGCKCNGTCFNVAKCACVCRYDRRGRLKKVAEDRSAIYECGVHCECDGEKCLNRVVQKGSNCSLCIFRTLKTGWGVKAIEDIEKGTMISQFCGEVITNKQSNQRAKTSEYQNKNMTYFFQTDDDLTIDATGAGNEARFFNHSCDPNMKVFQVITDFKSKLHKLVFFASKKIRKVTELTFDYRQKSKNRGGVICECGQKKCKKLTF